MEMHAYSEDYLLTAQRILGDMLDYAVNEYEFDTDEFYKMFLVSDVSRQLGWLGIGVLSVVYSKTVYEDIQSSNDRRSSKNVFRIS